LWAHHSLDIQQSTQAQEHTIIDQMASHAHVFTIDRELFGLKYEHWYISDGTYILEFDGDDIYNARVTVHQKQLPYRTVASDGLQFDFTPAAKQRAKKIIGATNYSLMLRNCEHVVTYIVHGAWRSLQTAPTAPIYKFFQAMFMGHVARLCNTLPEELQVTFMVRNTQRNPRLTQIAQYICSKPICDPGKAHKNVLVVGPTGTGKSDLINLLFNQTVVESRASLTSVTAHINFVLGTDSAMQRITIADTIGLCDTTLSVDEVLRLIKHSIKNNLVNIHKVLFLLPKRLTGNEVDACNKVIEMLHLNNHTLRVLFLINQTGSLSDTEKINLVGQVGQVLEFPYVSCEGNDGVLHNIVHCVDTQTRDVECSQIVSIFFKRSNNEKPITVDKSSCTIL